MKFIGLICGSRKTQNKGLEVWQTINNAIIFHDSMPSDCVVRVVKRNLDDTETEILYERGELE